MENGLKTSHEIRSPYPETKRPRHICAVSGSCLVQRPRSFIDSLLKAVPGLVHESLSGVSVFRLHFSNALFPQRSFAIERCTLFGYAPTSRTLIELWMSTPLLCHIGASSSFPASNRLRHKFKIGGVLVSYPLCVWRFEARHVSCISSFVRAFSIRSAGGTL